MDTSSLEQQIKAIEEEIFNTQKNKATEHHIGKLKAKLARLRSEVQKRKSAGGKGKGFAIKKSGDATVGIIGFPSIGKSTLLNQLTDANSRIGEYDFTTLDVIPGMMNYKGASLQVLDLPGLISGAAEGRGRGREILSAVRNVDLLLLMLDGKQLEHLAIMEQELDHAGLRLNQSPPDVVVRKTGQGGIMVHTTTRLTHLDEALVKAIASEYVINADITVREDITEDQLIDVFMGNRVYLPALVVINKQDLLSKEKIQQTMREIQEQGWQVVAISAKQGDGLDVLKETVFAMLQLIRVFLKPVGAEVDREEPLILRKGETVADACTRLHREFQEKFRYATVRGTSVKYKEQTVGLDHVLHDEDVLTIVIKR